LAHKLIRTFETKTGIDIPAKEEAMVDAWVSQGIRLAEEKAHQAGKKADTKMAGHEKLEHAASFALDMAEKNGWIAWTRDRLKAKIEAALNVQAERPGSPAGQ